MPIADRSEHGRSILAGIADEVLFEDEIKELTCLAELKAASEYELRYEIIEELGVGGMKTVYRAIDKKTHREVALAYIRAEKLSEKNVRYFVHESWITAKLEHPNIVPIYDIGVSPSGNPYFAMKLLSGETLRSILSKLDENVIAYTAKYSERDLLAVFSKLCDALSYAHERGVVHLDLKPDNIQISDFGQVFVLDWGIANVLRMFADESFEDTGDGTDYIHTRFSTIKGTPGFIAPELITTSKVEPDYKADVYGLGAILYSMLVYERPEPVATVTDAKEEGLFHEKTLELMETIPAPLQSVIRKAMSLSPDDRYDSVEALKSDVEAYMAGHATLAEEASYLRQQLLLIKRNARFFITIALSLFFIISLTIAFILQLAEREQEARESARRAVESTKQAVESEKHALINEKRALAQEKIASERELIANQLLKKYKAERELRKKREVTSALHYTAKAQQAFARCEPDEALRAINEYLKLYPGRPWVKYLKMQVLLAMNKFDTLINEMYEFKHSEHYKLAIKYSKIKKDSGAQWFTHFESFFNDVRTIKSGRKFTFLCNVFFHFNKGKTFSEQRIVLEKMQARFYPGSTFSYDPENDRITLQSHKHSAASMLAGLNFKQLDLSGVKVLFTEFLWRHRQLEYLNLKDGTIVDITMFADMPNLKYLNIENTLIPYLMKPKKVINLKYLNVANTPIRDFLWNFIRVDTINIIGTDHFDIAGYLESPHHPKKLILSESQLDQLWKSNTDGVQLFVYKDADAVNESDFF